MFKTLLIASAVALAFASPAVTENFDVLMLNKGDSGRMVFEPALVQIQPGDTVTFIATNKSHNAETIADMWPEGAEAFVGKMNKDVSVTLEIPGLYGVKCKPHFALGMVMVIQVGDAGDPTTFIQGRVPRKAVERFDAALADIAFKS